MPRKKQPKPAVNPAPNNKSKRGSRSNSSNNSSSSSSEQQASTSASSNNNSADSTGRGSGSSMTSLCRASVVVVVVLLALLLLSSASPSWKVNSIAAVSQESKSASTTTEETQQSCHADDENPSSDPSCLVEKDGHDDEYEGHEDTKLATFTSPGTYELLEIVPHDPKAFTQGLEKKNATHMYESVGMYKQSSIRIVEIATGKVVQETKLADNYFAEGISFWHGAAGTSSERSPKKELILLTWKETTAFRIDPDTLEILGNFSYSTSNLEGWGIACDNVNKRLYVTDGTQFLHTWHGETMQEIHKAEVAYQWPDNNQHQPPARPPTKLPYINELEWDGTSMLLANVWYQDVLLRIHPYTAFVHQIYNLKTLRPKHERESGEDCLNGIALDDQSDPNVVWVTGKYWPVMYKIRLIH